MEEYQRIEEALARLEARLSALEKGQGEIKEMLAMLNGGRKKSLPRLMSQRQVQDYLKISRKSIKKLVTDGVLTPVANENRVRNEAIRYKTSQVLALAGYV